MFGENFARPNFLTDNVKGIPIPQVSVSLSRRLAESVRHKAAQRSRAYTALEPYREFFAPTEAIEGLSWDRYSLLGDALEAEVTEAFGLTDDESRRFNFDLEEALESWRPDDDGEESGNALSYAHRLLSYLVGSAFGRWDVTKWAERMNPVAADKSDPLDPPKVCPPGMLVDSNLMPAKEAPAGYPIKLPPNRMLVDEPGHDFDIIESIMRVSSAIGVDREEFAHAALSTNDFRLAFRRNFFKAHLATYTFGRRKAPIYWPLTVESGRWGIWIYAPSLSRETLYAIASEALRREGHAAAEIARLEQERAGANGSRGAKTLDRALDDERKLAEELRRFREEAERVAGIGWEPDLDDGIVLCAAPLADLFPMWKESARYRKELRAGKHPWSAVARWADQL